MEQTTELTDKITESTKSEPTKSKKSLEQPKYHTSERRAKFAMKMIEKMETGKPYLADAYFQSGYHATTRRIAQANAVILRKHPEVQKILKTYKEILAEKLDPETRALKLAEIATSDDKRAALAALQEANRIFDEYPANKLKVQQFTDEIARLQENQ